jgi:multidrug efflux pump subunit AcrA (membrane-fusion protein)
VTEKWSVFAEYRYSKFGTVTNPGIATSGLLVPGLSRAYETRPVGFGVVERSISATGSVKALVTVDVGSQLSGLIAEMKADFNDSVQEGDLLAVIDRAPFEAKLASATANLAMARADNGRKDPPPYAHNGDAHRNLETPSPPHQRPYRPPGGSPTA